MIACGLLALAAVDESLAIGEASGGNAKNASTEGLLLTFLCDTGARLIAHLARSVLLRGFNR